LVPARCFPEWIRRLRRRRGGHWRAGRLRRVRALGTAKK